MRARGPREDSGTDNNRGLAEWNIWHLAPLAVPNGRPKKWEGRRGGSRLERSPVGGWVSVGEEQGVCALQRVSYREVQLDFTPEME